MGTLDVILVPSSLPSYPLVGKTAVVIDVLRATSTMCQALAQGAQGIIPVATPEEAFAYRAHTSEPPLIGGERLGKKLPGFDFGNSPREYRRERVQGRRILLTTTNGTRTLLDSSRADEVWIGSFLNRQACCAQIRKRQAIVLVCSGKEGRFCIEDAACAGAFVDALQAHGEFECTDAALAAWAIYQRWASDLPRLLRLCEHGRYLAHIGLEADLTFCARLDELDVNGLLRDDQIGRVGKYPPDAGDPPAPR